jgi:hypothetical protein
MMASYPGYVLLNAVGFSGARRRGLPAEVSDVRNRETLTTSDISSVIALAKSEKRREPPKVDERIRKS